MKNKLLLTMMCMLCLLMSVNAQEDLVVTIDGTVGECRKTTSKNVPAFCANKWAITQQFYTVEEIAKSHGVIESIAFKTAEMAEEEEKYPFTRNLIVYMVNTDEYAVAGNTMKVMSPADQVFSGNVEFSYNTWIEIDIEDFEYTGKNLLICVNDVTGTNVSGGITFEAFIGATMIGENNGYRALFKRSISEAFDATKIITGASTILDTPVPLVQLTFKAGTTGEYLEPSTPTNFTATALDESSVLLAWDGDENTSAYDVCKGVEVIANVTETSYIVNDLPLGLHCFKIIGVNGPKRSAATEILCVDLVETPPTPEIPEDGIEEQMSSLVVCPNPVGDMLCIKTEVDLEEIVIFDVFGRQLSVVGGVQSPSIDVSGFDVGVYFLRIKTYDGFITKRFVKQ